MSDPVERFRSWWKANDGKIKRLCQIQGWSYADAWEQGPRMAGWLFDKMNDERKSFRKKADVKNWLSFIRNWMTGYYKSKVDKVHNMSAAEEERYYASKRRPQGNSDLERMD